MNLTDAEILREIQLRNQKVFEFLFKKYYGLLCYEARGYIKNQFLVEEIVGDVFTRIWTNCDRIQIKTSFREYLVKATHNACIDYYRNQKLQERLKEEIEAAQQNQFTLSDLGENPLDYILTQELEDRISRAIEALPDQYKRTFKLSRFNDLTYDEIASEMGISVNSVKTNIKNSLAKLRIQLSDIFVLLAIWSLKN